MKKLMFAVAALTTGAVFADGITSANIVGYAPAEAAADGEGVAAGACFIPTSGTTIDLGELTVTGYTGEPKNALDIQTLDEYGTTDRTFTWRDYYNSKTKKQMLGWYESSTAYADLEESEKVKLAPGEGLFAQSNLDDLSIQSAGTVATAGDVETEAALDGEGLTVVNPTPVSVDLGSVKVTGYTGEPKNALDIQTMDEYGTTDRTFTWRDYYNSKTKKQMYGWYEGSTAYDDLDESEKVTIKPGLGLFAQSNLDDLKIVWPKVEVAE